MSTKANPGQYDCFAKLAIDEPYFVIRAKDVVGAEIVREWAARRAAMPGNENNPKIHEALECADSMEVWRQRYLSGQACGCDRGVNHLCDHHDQPHVKEMVAMLERARAEVNADLWMRLHAIIQFAAVVQAAVGDIGIEDAKLAIQRNVLEVFAGVAFKPDLRRVE